MQRGPSCPAPPANVPDSTPRLQHQRQGTETNVVAASAPGGRWDHRRVYSKDAEGLGFVLSGIMQSLTAHHSQHQEFGTGAAASLLQGCCRQLRQLMQQCRRAAQPPPQSQLRLRLAGSGCRPERRAALAPVGKGVTAAVCPVSYADRVFQDTVQVLSEVMTDFPPERAEVGQQQPDLSRQGRCYSGSVADFCWLSGGAAPCLRYRRRRRRPCPAADQTAASARGPGAPRTLHDRQRIAAAAGLARESAAAGRLGIGMAAATEVLLSARESVGLPPDSQYDLVLSI